MHPYVFVNATKKVIRNFEATTIDMEL